MVELSRVELGEGRCSSEVVVDWSEELREAGSVDYITVRRIQESDSKNPVESGKTGFSEVGKNPN
ncbi:hypothetical protein CROQUDRAFT_653102 [Cronartium quercuum f. sp. fusiforme G11]|uniref:Uncharacterized protein n=1 Tax=Cronartium quercuum f. sp. fusiforme G11 TaxID=708437 RepID=A0A9P6NT56_9BASI|nr:hypothetical protein CROQUDRAFT_653102 [Cronartium quercuum f. sp. fusiforme G11]